MRKWQDSVCGGGVVDTRTHIMLVFKLLESSQDGWRIVRGGGTGMLTVMISDANPGTSTLSPPR